MLVVGDYRYEDTFVSKAWERICFAYRQQPEETRYGEVPAPSRKMTPHPRELSPLRRIARDAAPNLYPVPFSDLGDCSRPDVAERLYQYLSHFDVWAVIACGTASSTQGLLRTLQPSSLPVFVTVDSTAEMPVTNGERPSSYRNALRLMPNNDLQAQAILSKLTSLVEQGADVDVQVLCHGENEEAEYVRDLRKALESHASKGPGRPQLRFCSEVDQLRPIEENGILVCVGYFEAVRLIARVQHRWRHIILSDGCYEERVRAYIVGIEDGADFHWTRPAFDHSEYAHDAYLAINKIWRRIRADRHAGVSERSLIPFERRVRSVLQRDRPTHYRFRGTDNQHGGYLIEKVRSAQRLAIRIYDARLQRSKHEQHEQPVHEL
ncbi:hypothetical protein GCM10023307_03380 [Lysobacter hankyongensis]|uniref:ABC transporter substrate-binding protein n=1 Tax=Lysobacter hankyongensis TaxID=1176535 RepID=A0ABP9AJT9_9GAMM